MIIPGILISAITFPGVVAHELSHQICCRICKLPVYEVKYFQVQNPSGYVVHQATDVPWKNFLTAMGPFFFNTLFGILIMAPVSIRILGFHDYYPLDILLAWLGISILMHAFPSIGDANNLVHSILRNPDVSILTKIVTAPFIGFVYLGAIGSVFWLDLAYALAMSWAIPKLLLLFL